MFGFLSTVSSDVVNAAHTAEQATASWVNSVVTTAQNDPQLGGLVQSTTNSVRTDLANAVADLGAGATNYLTTKISPANAPTNVPITAAQKRGLALFAILVIVVIGLVLWRRR